MLQIDRTSSVHVDEGSIRDSGSGYGPPPSEGSSPADLLAAIVEFCAGKLLSFCRLSL